MRSSGDFMLLWGWLKMVGRIKTTKMKIRVDLNVSQSGSSITVTLDDLGLTEENWASMDEGQQKDAIQEYVNDLPEQPYFTVSSHWEAE